MNIKTTKKLNTHCLYCFCPATVQIVRTHEASKRKTIFNWCDECFKRYAHAFNNWEPGYIVP